MKILSAIFVLIGVICMVKGKSKSHNIDEPCKSNLNLECVRKYFQKYGNCSVVSTPNYHPSYDVNLPIYLPKMNLTVVTTKIYPSNLDAEIKEFYVDKVNGKFMISINFKRLFCDAPETIFSVSQNGKEPKVVSEYVNATYPTNTVITTEIIAVHGLTVDSLRKATISAHFTHNDIVMNIGPKFAASEDPVISAAYDALLADTFTASQEIFRTKAAFYFFIYLQNFICDFGVPPTLQNDYDTTVLTNVIDKDVDTEESFTKPCDNSGDVNSCVVDFFAKHGSCSVLREPKDEPVLRSFLTTYIPSLNVSVDTVDSHISGLNGNIKQFYINEQTENLVMSVDYPGIVMNASIVIVRQHQKGQPHNIFIDSNKDLYPVQLTAVIPQKDGITSDAIKKAVVSAYFPHSGMTYEFGPYISENKDPDLVPVLTSLAHDPVTVAKEIFVTEGKSMFLAYLQNYICDFSVPISDHETYSITSE